MTSITSVPYLNMKKAHLDLIPSLKQSLENVINSGNLVLGESVSKFEKEYARYSQVKYSVGLANGLDALILSLMSLGIGKGDEVIVASNTYIATLLAISRVGAMPVLVEPKIDTYNIDPLKIENAISKKTKAIIPVHLFGQICEMDKIIKIANKFKLFIVEDNAQSHGSTFKGKKAGSFGDINATSFYPGKNLGALGDGGAITTNNKKIFEEIKMLRNYGSKIKYVNDIKGYNSRLDELQAAFLSVKLKKLNEKNNLRKKLAQQYLKDLSNVGDLILPRTAEKATHVYHIFTIRTNKRNKLQKYLTDNKVATMIHYPIPPHLQNAYKELGFRKGSFPIAEELANTSLSIPIFPEMTTSEQEYVIEKIKRFYE